MHPSATSKEHVEDVHRRRSSTHSSLFNCLFSSLIIQVSFLWIRQDLIGLGDVLKLERGGI